jgi:DNA-binding NarL/FixJ family response regulator
MEVLGLLAEGLSIIKEVASKLGIATRTAGVHTSNAMRVLDLHNRVQLVWWAIHAGLVRLEPSPKEPGEPPIWEPRRIK